MPSLYSAKKRNLARGRYNKLVGLANDIARVYNAGWIKGEWTCCKCGLVIGKQKETRSVPSYGAAARHSRECGEENGSF